MLRSQKDMQDVDAINRAAIATCQANMSAIEKLLATPMNETGK